MTITTSTDTAAAIDQLVAGATKALAEYARFTQEDVDRLVKKAAVAALDQHGQLAELAVRERPDTSATLFADRDELRAAVWRLRADRRARREARAEQHAATARGWRTYWT